MVHIDITQLEFIVDGTPIPFGFPLLLLEKERQIIGLIERNLRAEFCVRVA